MSSFIGPYALELGAAIAAQARRDPRAEGHAEKAAMWRDLHETANEQRKRGTGGRHHVRD